MTRSLARACTLLCLAGTAWARDAPPQAPSAVVVEVAAAGEPAVTSSMAKRIHALGTRLGVSTRWQARTAILARDVLSDKGVEAGILARVWLDLSDPKRAVLYVANAAHDRFLVRVVPADDGYGELTQESLTTILESVVDALVAGGQIGVDRKEATHKIEEEVGVRVEPAPPPVVVAPAAAEPPAAAPLRDEGTAESSHAKRRGPRSVLDVSYRMDVVADGPSIRQGPQVALSLDGFLSSSLDVLLWFGGHYAPSSTLGEGTERVRLHGGGARAAAGLTGRIGSVFAWRFAAGAGVDAFDVQAEIAPESGWVGANGYTIAIPIATSFAGGSIHAARWLDVPFAFGVDADLSSHHFDAQSGAERTVLIQPWVVHPFATLGIGVPLQ